MSWALIAVLAFGAYGLKAFGVFVLGGRRFDERLRPLSSLLPAAIFAALIVVQTVGKGGDVQIDARFVGVAAAVVAVWRRAPFIAVILIAMAATAALRLVATEL